jgi:hypothetical protein
VKALLQRKPAYRLGQGTSGAAAIKKHAWFNGFDWDAFGAKKLKAPYLPVVRKTSSHFAFILSTCLVSQGTSTAATCAAPCCHQVLSMMSHAQQQVPLVVAGPAHELAALCCYGCVQQSQCMQTSPATRGGGWYQ